MKVTDTAGLRATSCQVIANSKSGRAGGLGGPARIRYAPVIGRILPNTAAWGFHRPEISPQTLSSAFQGVTGFQPLRFDTRPRLPNDCRAAEF